MTRKFVDQSRFHELARARQEKDVAVVTTRSDTPVEVDTRTLRFCFSDGSVDRMGDTISAHGWDLFDFKRNPIALFAHDAMAPPIGRAGNLAVEYGRLMGDITFTPPEVYEFGDTIYKLLAGKFLRAVSVGFLPGRYAFVEDDPDRPWGVDFISGHQLLEISVVPVPANVNALAEARSKGIDVRPLVRGGMPAVSRATQARVRAWAAEPPRRSVAQQLSEMDDRMDALAKKRALRAIDERLEQRSDAARRMQRAASIAYPHGRNDRGEDLRHAAALRRRPR